MVQSLIAPFQTNLDLSLPSHSLPHISYHPVLIQDPASIAKKKKKKKQKKPPSNLDLVNHARAQSAANVSAKPPVLCISRNKHWRYISSYHGPWLQLPLELLETLSVANSSPQASSVLELSSNFPRLEPHLSLYTLGPADTRRDRGFESIPETTFVESRLVSETPGTYTNSPYDTTGPNPPPIDPGVFKSVTAIRRLIDEASELSVRASSGLSAAEFASTRGTPSLNNSTWSTAQALGINPVGNGRGSAMSAMRIRRLRALAVQKLAQAYKIDEIASSVMVMQGGSVFDDLAERVLKADPYDCDARYVHFFHEKIPSRRLAESTTTSVLDELIAAQPQNLHYYRTRGIVHCFRDEYPQATKDFTFALKEARAVRRSKSAHSGQMGENRKGKKKKKGTSKLMADLPLEDLTGGDTGFELSGGGLIQVHPSVLPGAPDPIELQLLFMRGATHLQHAIFLIEGVILQLEGITKDPSVNGAELRLCHVDGGKYGGVEIRNPLGPLGNPRGSKAQAYRAVLTEQPFKREVIGLIKKSIRDHEKFLSFFDTLEGPPPIPATTLEDRIANALAILETSRSSGQRSSTPSTQAGTPSTFTTYHPLLVEAHFSILLCLVMLADFSTILPTFVRVATLLDGLEGYPVFLPPRSMAQADFIEILERLTLGWKTGIDYTLSSNALVPFSAISLNVPSSSRSSSIHSSPTIPSENLMPSLPRTPTNTGSESDSDSVYFKRERSREENLDSIRILLTQVFKRRKERAERSSIPNDGVNKPVPVSIPLHGPRIEVILAWVAAVHLVELDGAA